jgi:hypothetical protein
VAILVSLFATMLLACLGLTLALLGSAEAALAANDGQSKSAIRAAEGALTLALSELRARPDWSGVLTEGAPDVCAVPGVLTDTSLLPHATWDSSLIDLQAATAALQAATESGVASSAEAPVWRLFEYGPISRVMPGEAPPWYLAVWTAGGRDGVLLVHATALGPGGLRPSVDASVARDAGGRLIRLATRTSP